jgi:MFS family permease
MESPQSENKAVRIKAHIGKTFKALNHRNYRLWFFGQMFSLFGTWMQSSAQGFFIFELTHSVFYLGLVGFMTGLPTWLFMLYGGVVSDRFSRKKILLVTQFSMMLLALILSLLYFTGLIRPWHILVLSFLLGTANAFDAPARQSFVVDLVPREDLNNAIALNATMFNASIVVGPALGGIVYALVGPGWCFMINALSFIAVISGIIFMRIEYQKISVGKSSAFSDIKEGLLYVGKKSAILGIFSAIACFSLFGLAFINLLPAWSVNVLHGNSETNGLLQAARGFGALLVALSVASIGSIRVKGRLLTLGTFLVPLFIFIFSLIAHVPASVAVIILVGISGMLVSNMCMTLLQNITADEFRGRVLSIQNLVFSGFLPFGSLWIGTAAGFFGEQTAVIMSAALAFLGAVAIWKLFPALRTTE